MVAATTNTDPSPTETLADNTLNAEIAPAMLERLRNDGESRGEASAVILGLSAGIAWAYAAGVHLSFTLINPQVDAVSAGMFVWVLAFAFLREFYSRRAIASELTYRRQHGKWRWDH